VEEKDDDDDGEQMESITATVSLSKIVVVDNVQGFLC
jgi:hypothetical protein